MLKILTCGVVAGCGWQGSVLFVLMCFFAQLGMLMFGGALYPGNPALTNSSFDELGYYPSNFNDFASSLVVLFVRLPRNHPLAIVSSCWHCRVR